MCNDLLQLRSDLLCVLHGLAELTQCVNTASHQGLLLEVHILQINCMGNLMYTGETDHAANAAELCDLQG